jgi:hypothetical protein
VKVVAVVPEPGETVPLDSVISWDAPEHAAARASRTPLPMSVSVNATRIARIPGASRRRSTTPRICLPGGRPTVRKAVRRVDDPEVLRRRRHGFGVRHG